MKPDTSFRHEKENRSKIKPTICSVALSVLRELWVDDSCVVTLWEKNNLIAIHSWELSAELMTNEDKYEKCWLSDFEDSSKEQKKYLSDLYDKTL